jgi:supervillin
MCIHILHGLYFYDFVPLLLLTSIMLSVSAEEEGGLPIKSDSRPSWALFAKVSENMETILFKEKFIDWPDAAKIIKVKGQDDDQEKVSSSDLKIHGHG